MFPPSSGSSPFFKPSSQKPTSSTQQQDYNHQQTNSSEKHGLALMIREFDSMELEKITENHQKNTKQNQQNQLKISGTSYGEKKALQAASVIKPVGPQSGGVPNKARRSRNKNLRLRSQGVNLRPRLTSKGASMKLPRQTANKFFDLQEMLGFKDSNQTMDWLLKQPKAAIQGLPDRKLSFSNEAHGTESASSCSGLGTKMKKNKI